MTSVQPHCSHCLQPITTGPIRRYLGSNWCAACFAGRPAAGAGPDPGLRPPWLSLRREGAGALRRDLRWGLEMAAFFAAFYSLIALARLAALLPWGRWSVGSVLHALGASVGAYVAAALVAGPLLGLVRPLTRARPGAALAGALAGAPAAWAGMRVLHGAVGGWEAGTGWVALFYGLVAGALFGSYMWEAPPSRPEPASARPRGRGRRRGRAT